MKGCLLTAFCNFKLFLMNIENLYSIFLKSSGINTDTRNISHNSLFFALKGENFDGNSFAAEALQKGSIYAVVDDKTYKDKERFIYVDNVLRKLQELARFHRRKLNVPVIAITGSNGKTTTKELCNGILCKKFRTIATKGNLNNHIGVPLTILSSKDPQIIIVEMGANHEGEIKTLCSIAEPDYGLITNIGIAHLEGFGSAEGIKRAKAELYDFIKTKKGRVFLNTNNPTLAELVNDKKIDSIEYGDSPDSICYGEIIEKSSFLNIRLIFAEKSINIQTQLIGAYNLENIVAAAAIGRNFDVSIEDINSAVENYVPSNSRSQYIMTENNKLILDAYNANPSSMNHSILNFLSMKDEDEKIVILGDMLELGNFSDEEHLKIVNLLKDRNIKKVYLVGQEFSKASINSDFMCFDKVDSLLKYFESNPVKNKIIFLKGSRGLQLENLIKVL